jgi:2-dehydropantoate 2-reductase
MRIAIFGAGAVGAYVGGRLAQAGVPVAFLARGDHLHALASHGL